MVVIAVGRGGFIIGAGVVLKAPKPSVKVIGVEPVGSPALHASPGDRRSGFSSADYDDRSDDGVQAHRRCIVRTVADRVDEVVLVSDVEIQDAAQWLWFECGLAADLGDTATIAALATGTVSVEKGQTVVAPVCGVGLPA